MLLIRLHKKYSNERYSHEESQMCVLWSTDYPPDVLENTPPLDELEEALGFGFYEEDAVEFYDMEIKDAAIYIHDVIKSWKE